MLKSVTIGPPLKTLLGEEFLLAEKAVTRSIRGAGQSLKGRWRTQISAAGLGKGLANTVRSESYPKTTESINAAAVVFSKAPRIISAHDEGAVIRSREGFWLAIPLPAAGRARGRRRMTPYTWEQQNRIPLRFVFLGRGRALLVADDARLTGRGLARRKGGRRRKKDGILTGAQTVPIFLLVPQVRMRKRLNLAADIAAVAADLPSNIIRNWGR